MPKKRRSQRSGSSHKRSMGILKEVLSLYVKIADLKREMSKVTEGGEQAEDRLTNIEIHVNILARLLTTICMEKLGIRAGALKCLVRRVEKDAVRDSQIMELESLYRLSRENSKKTPPANAKSKVDPWDQIS